VVTHLAGGLDSFPDTEVDDDEDGHETQDQLPAR